MPLEIAEKGRCGGGEGLSKVVWRGVRTCSGEILKDSCSGENANMKMVRNERIGWRFFFFLAHVWHLRSGLIVKATLKL